jgi:histidinol-phosphate aminotransferase
MLNLSRNENPLGCSPKALSALRTISPHTLATYPAPNQHPLIGKLAQQLKISKEQLFLSNGSDFIFYLLLKAFAKVPNTHVLLHEYSFCTYALSAKTLNIPVQTVPINADWQVNIQSLIHACDDKTSMIFLANPNNPTGRLIPACEIKAILDAIPPTTLLVIDEAYIEYAAPQYQFDSIDWLETHHNLIITRTFSKLYGLAGLRLGYAVAHPSIIETLQELQLPFTVNQAALAAANAALDDGEFIQLSLTTNAEGMAQLSNHFQQWHISYLPSACNFITFDCTKDSTLLYQHLLSNNIQVRQLHAYQMEHYLRVTIGTKANNELFLAVLERFL